MKHLPEAALNQHTAIVGKTGSGKTVTAKVIVEHLLDKKRQVCVLDPTGAWWGLRLMADGKRRGYDIVLIGGARGDLPLVERSGAAIARLVTEQHANVVIDTSGFTVGEYTRWFIDFAGTLYTTIRAPLHLVIDEAHYFMPQQGAKVSPDAARMLHAGNRLMSGGRSKGIRGMLITQRPAKLHKDSLTCADTLIAMRVMSPQDRKAIKEWVDGMGDPVLGKEVLDTLALLQKGEAWVWYPEGGHLKRTQFPMMATYDSSRTPEHGAKAGPQVSEINLDEVRKALAEAVKEAEANDPKLLRAEIARLRKEASAKQPAAAPAAKVDDKAIERAVQRAASERDKHWQKPLGDLQRTVKMLTGRLGQIAKLASLNGEVPKVEVPPAISLPAIDKGRNLERVRNQPRLGNARAPNGARSSAPVGEAGDISLGKCERAILQVLSQFPEGCEKGKLTLLAGYAYSGGFRNSLSALRTAGYIKGDNEDVMTITPAGEACGPFEALPTGEALRKYWLRNKHFGKCERAIMKVLFDAYPSGIPGEEIGQHTDPRYEYSGGFRNSLSALRTAGIIVGKNTDEIRASDHLFEGATV